ncbi:MAG: DPP IV N-terminal domain-containing protein, partial [Pseudomonadales bacterium]
MQLTVERLFSDPPLTGSLPSSAQIAPDGSSVAFLRVAGDDRERLDLWRYDVAAGTSTLWLDARQLAAVAGAGDGRGQGLQQARESAAEKAERERRRQFSRGITSFTFNADGSALLLPVEGAGYLLDTRSGGLRRVTPADGRHTDLRFSPRGSSVSYVRSGNLYCTDLASGEERALTSDGGGTVCNGRAEFIAQEEMHRFDGHWWSPDERFVAFTRVDESPVPETQRYEIEADTINVIAQRYPFAGGANAEVRLLIIDLGNGQVRELDYQTPGGDGPCADYLARVDWLGRHLVVQRQSRDQKSLTLLRFDPASGTCDTLLREQADTWINLHDNFRGIDAE